MLYGQGFMVNKKYKILLLIIWILLFSITIFNSKEKQNSKLNDPDYLIDAKTGDYWQNQLYSEKERSAHHNRENYGKSQTWNEAFKYCKQLNIDGITGWELPTKAELYQMSLLTSKYKDNPGWLHWTSTTVQDNVNLAYCINFHGGMMMTCNKKHVAYVKCIKKGSTLNP